MAAAGGITAAAAVVASTSRSGALLGVGLAALGLILFAGWLALRGIERRAKGLAMISARAFFVTYALVIVVLIAIVLIIAAQDNWSGLAGKSLGR